MELEAIIKKFFGKSNKEKELLRQYLEIEHKNHPYTQYLRHVDEYRTYMLRYL